MQDFVDILSEERENCSKFISTGENGKLVGVLKYVGFQTMDFLKKAVDLAVFALYTEIIVFCNLNEKL